MEQDLLNETTITVLKDLQDDITEMLSLGSNIEVAWKLDKLHFQNALLTSANLIRKSISHGESN